MLVGWSTQTPVGYGPTGSSGRQPKLGTGVRGTSTAAGPSGGAALGEGASVAPPPTLAPVEPAPPAASDSGECRPRRVDARHCARLPALIAELTSPDREIILLRIVAGLSITDVVAALGVTPAAIRLAQQQALSALQPTATANGPPPAARQRVVLLPHARTELIGNRPNNRRTGRATGMDQGDSPRQHWTGGTRAIATATQWHDAELAMKVAGRSFEEWLLAGQEDPSTPATMQAYHTHVALHEAARVIATLIETFRVEVSGLISAPTRDADIPAQRR